MRKSKLERYEAILEALVNKPMTNDEIAYETNMNCDVLGHHLDSLTQNGLVEDRAKGKRTLYALTDRGATVFKTLNFRKYLQKVSNALRTLDDAVQILPVISEHYKKDEEKE